MNFSWNVPRISWIILLIIKSRYPAHIISFPALTLAVGSLGSIIYGSRTCTLLELTAYKLFQFTEDLGVQLVIVNIADENDNGPLFTKKLYTGGNLFFLIYCLILVFFGNFTLNILFLPLKTSLPWQKISCTTGATKYVRYAALLNPYIFIKKNTIGRESFKNLHMLPKVFGMIIDRFILNVYGKIIVEKRHTMSLCKVK